MNLTMMDTIQNLPSFESITEGRKKALQGVITYIQEKVNSKKAVNLHFICTHNSRRSHLSQIWAKIAAFHYDVSNVNCYSGGTEISEINHQILDTLKTQGCTIAQLSTGINPIYAVKFTDNEPAIIAYSKKFDDIINPKSSFAAIMTCTDADQGCPYIPGAEQRFSLAYEDPKKSDGTPLQTETYRLRSIEIATEMMFIFSKIEGSF
ncbi:protein-tyrosine-phosphatase [Sphingobacterium sp. HJSM2_6]